MLSKSEHHQEDSIAIHYASCAKIAEHLHELIQIRRQRPAPELDDLIERVTLQIKERHREDLGIELSWENDRENNSFSPNTPPIRHLL